MRVWRLGPRKYARFDGEGARLAGGRWNHRGTAMVYTSATISLAALELFVHLDPDEAPADLVVIPGDIPDALAVRVVRAADLVGNWRQYPAPGSLADLGTRWAGALQTPVLGVPSAVVPQEMNYLLNPAHPGFKKIAIGRREPFSFDLRMWKRVEEGRSGAQKSRKPPDSR